jgi:hypothetical protein
MMLARGYVGLAAFIQCASGYPPLVPSPQRTQSAGSSAEGEDMRPLLIVVAVHRYGRTWTA